MELIGFTLGTIGKVLVAYTAIAVHYRVREEHKIDDRVFTTMKKEHLLGILGIVLMIVGYILEVPFKTFL